MMLYILRHATAEEAASSGDDGARKLTERSKEKMRAASAGLRAMGLKFDAILTSPLARAAETAEIVSAAYENTPPPQVLPALATGVAAADAVDGAARICKAWRGDDRRPRAATERHRVDSAGRRRRRRSSEVENRGMYRD